MRLRISLQYLLSYPSIFDLQDLRRPMFLDPFCSSFFSMEERALQAVLLDPMVFLYATERRFLSSTLRSALAATTLFMASSMSSNLSVCSVILAIQRCQSLVLAVIYLNQIKTSTKISHLNYHIYNIQYSYFYTQKIDQLRSGLFLLKYFHQPKLSRRIHPSRLDILGEFFIIFVIVRLVYRIILLLFSLIIQNFSSNKTQIRQKYLKYLCPPCFRHFYGHFQWLLSPQQSLSELIIDVYNNSYLKLMRQHTIYRTLLVALMLAFACCQQVCLKQQCPRELAACDLDCKVLMGKCAEFCTLNSRGCVQKCIGDNGPAQDLLDCTFNKCISL